MKTKIRLLFALLFTSISLYSQSSDSKDLKNIRIDSITGIADFEAELTKFTYESNTIIKQFFQNGHHYTTEIFTYDSLISKFIQYEFIDEEDSISSKYTAYYNKGNLEKIDLYKKIGNDSEYLKEGEYNYISSNDTITILYLENGNLKKKKIELIYDNGNLLSKYEYEISEDLYSVTRKDIYTYSDNKKTVDIYFSDEFTHSKDYFYFDGKIIKLISSFNDKQEFNKQEFKENNIELKNLNWLGFDINIYEPAYIQYEKDPESGEWVKSYETFLHYSEITNVNSIKPIKANIAKVYPNPFTDRININIESGILNAQFILSDLQGKTIKVQEVNGEQIDLSNLSPGYYIYTITNNNQTQSGKLLKN